MTTKPFITYIKLVENTSLFGFLLIEEESGEALASRSFSSELMRDKVAGHWSTKLKVPIVRLEADTFTPDFSNVIYLTPKKR